MKDLVKITREELIRFQALEKAANNVISPKNTHLIPETPGVEVNEAALLALRDIVEAPANSYARLWDDDGK